MTSTIGRTGNHEGGFTYIMALLAVALVTITSATAYSNTRQVIGKAQEEELLFRGMAIQSAIEAYYQARIPHEYPARLEDLLRDPRFMQRRHLRQLYTPPDGKPWHLLSNGQGRVMGVYYNSEQRPWQQVGFSGPLQTFNGAQHYRDWRFVYLPSSSN